MFLYEILVKRKDSIYFKASVKEALKQMVDNSLSYVVLVDSNDIPLGILTEKDISSAYHKNISLNKPLDRYFKKTLIKTFPQRDIDFAISLMIDYQIRRIVIVDKNNKFLGVIEHSDLVYALEKKVFKVGLKLKEILNPSREALHVSMDKDLEDILILMKNEMKNSVLVFDKDEVVGILTQKDILNFAYNDIKRTTKIDKLMHFPVKFIDSGLEMLKAIDFMKRNGFRHLVVREDEKFYVITPDNIIKNLKGNYIKLLEEKIKVQRNYLDDLGYIFIELVRFDSEQVVQFANRNAKEVLGVDINSSIKDFIPKDIWHKTLEAFKTNDNIEFENVCIGDKYFKYLANQSRYSNDHHSVINIILIDIDNFYKKNRKLKEQIDEIGTASKKLDIQKREIFNQNAIGIGYISLDGKIFLSNKYLLNLLGYKANEVIGKNMFDYIYKDDIDLTKEYLKKILHDKDCSEIHIEKRYMHKKGFPVWVSLSLYISRDANEIPRYYIGFVKDIRERKKIEAQREKLHKTLREAAKVFDNAAEAICILDKNKKIVNVNDAFKSITKYKEKDVLHKNFLEYFISKKSNELINNSLKNKGFFKGEMEGIKNDGNLFPMLVNISSVTDSKGKIENYVLLFSDISAIKSTEKKLEFLANHDTLTNLPNRLYLSSNMEHILKVAKRNNTKVAVIFMDLDKFKQINDSFGHDYGDEVLREIAVRLKKVLREKDLIARIGGDEFVIVIEDILNILDIEFIMDKIFSIFLKPFIVKNREFKLGASFGVSIYPDDSEEIEDLIKNSDIAMYQAKKGGGRNFYFYTKKYSDTLINKINIEDEIEKGIKNREFVLYYQPQMSKCGKKIISVEALIRWKHPTRGLLAPDKFIPIAEESGQIVQLGKYVLEAVCSQMVNWLKSNIDIRKVAVNISYIQLKKKNFYRLVTNTIKKTGIDPIYLDFELTEKFLMDDRNAQNMIQKLKKLGISISLDDFGMGYSSLNSLKELPIDNIKIDRTFVKDTPKKRKDINLLNSMINLGNSLDLNVVIEGVERESQLKFLEDKEIYSIQGFIYSKPLSVRKFEEFYQKFS